MTTKGEHEGVFRGMKLFCNLIVLVVTQTYKYVKIHKPEHQKKEKVKFTI